MNASARVLAAASDARATTVSLDSLATKDGRADIASIVSVAFTPALPLPDVWVPWLNGGGVPPEFIPPNYVRARSPRGFSQDLKRAVSHCERMEEEALEHERAAALSTERASAARSSAERERIFLQAYSVRALMMKLAEVNQSRFSMGPAWTLLEAIHLISNKRDIWDTLRLLQRDEVFLFALAESIELVCGRFAERVSEKRELASSSMGEAGAQEFESVVTREMIDRVFGVPGAGDRTWPEGFGKSGTGAFARF